MIIGRELIRLNDLSTPAVDANFMQIEITDAKMQLDNSFFQDD